MNLTVRALRQRLASGEPTFLLDVRSAREFATWKVEGPRPIDSLHVPYTKILGDVDDEAAFGATQVVARAQKPRDGKIARAVRTHPGEEQRARRVEQARGRTARERMCNGHTVVGSLCLDWSDRF